MIPVTWGDIMEFTMHPAMCSQQEWKKFTRLNKAGRRGPVAGLAGPGAPAGALDGEATALVDDAGPTMELSAEEGLLHGAEAGLGGGLAAALHLSGCAQ